MLGWFAPSMILMKILFHHLWEIKVEWDEEVPQVVRKKYHKLYERSTTIMEIPTPCSQDSCYYPLLLPTWKCRPHVRTARFFRCFRGCIRGCSLSSCSIPQKISVFGTSHSQDEGFCPKSYLFRGLSFVELNC